MREGQTISFGWATLAQCARCSGSTHTQMYISCNPRMGWWFKSAFWKRWSELGLIRRSYLCGYCKDRIGKGFPDWDCSKHECSVNSVESNSSTTLWTVACQASPSMGFLQARILEWVAMPFPTQGLNLCLLRLLQEDSLPLSSGEALSKHRSCQVRNGGCTVCIHSPETVS